VGGLAIPLSGALVRLGRSTDRSVQPIDEEAEDQAGKERLQGRHQQPHLDDEKDRDQGDGAADGGQPRRWGDGRVESISGLHFQLLKQLQHGLVDACAHLLSLELLEGHPEIGLVLGAEHSIRHGEQDVVLLADVIPE